MGLLCNPAAGRARLLALADYIFMLGVCAILYLLVKLLVYSEHSTFANSDLKMKWFWMNFAWSIVATVLNVYVFSILHKSDIPCRSSVVEVPLDDERSPLLGDNANTSVSINESTETADDQPNEEKDDDEKKKKKLSELVKKVTIRKMLSYSKKDIGFIVPAILFLLAAAVAEAFIPLFTGRVISGTVLFFGIVVNIVSRLTGIRCMSDGIRLPKNINHLSIVDLIHRL